MKILILLGLLLQTVKPTVTLIWDLSGAYKLFRQTGNCYSASATLNVGTSLPFSPGTFTYVDTPPKPGFYCYYVITDVGRKRAIGMIPFNNVSVSLKLQ